jgi:hypothetical protein
MKQHVAVGALFLVGCGASATGIGVQTDAEPIQPQMDAAPANPDAPAVSPDGPVVAPDAKLADAPPPSPDAALDAPLPELDASMADARLPDARLPDARLPDARLPDARLADARLPDASPPDAGSCPPLTTSLDEDMPYLVHNAGSSTDVTSVVVGSGPFSCTQLFGDGRGTKPADVLLTSCTLTGGAGATDKAGTYGFLVRVRSVCGSTVDVPVAFKNGDCDPSVTLTPAAWPPFIPDNPTDGYVWQMTETQPTCSGFGISLFTKSPFTFASNLNCANTGTICLDCGTSCVTCDTGTATFAGAITVRSHPSLRPGLPGWSTIEVVQFIFPAGSTAWTCHFETLER